MERLTKHIAVSTGSSGARKKIDKKKMRQFLSISPYRLEKRRDLELYYRETGDDVCEVLVLDNELPLFGNTTLEDVTIRRSPELKEMVRIRNIFKILNDGDILICKGRDALYYVRDRALESLDLHYEKQDILDMADEGLKAFARAETDDVLEILELFFHVLGYVAVPAEVLVNDYVMYGAESKKDGGTFFGPIVMYNDKTNTLKAISNMISMTDPVARNMITAVALGEMSPEKEGLEVFPFLAEAIPLKKAPTVH